MIHPSSRQVSAFRRYLVPQLFVFLLAAITLVGCLSDPITGPQVFYRGIFKPNTITHRDTNYNAATRTGDLVVRWTRSESDTQLNFKGYYIKLYPGIRDPIDTVTHAIIPAGPAIDSVHVGIGIHQYIFHNLPLKLYSVAVWGERIEKPTRPDSLTLSFDSAGQGFSFDPRPLLNPTNLRAVSGGSNTVKLMWDLPATDTQSNVSGYVVYYHKALPIHDTILRTQFVTLLHTDTVTINGLPSGPDIFPETDFTFWVKTLRGDSTLGGPDSSIVTWAGAVQLSNAGQGDSSTILQVISGNGIFIGQNNQGYAILSERNDSAEIKVNITGQQVTLSGTSFVPTGDEANRIDSIYYLTPFLTPAYTQSSFTLPNSSSHDGFVVYALLPNSDPALTSEPLHVRLFFRKDPATGSFVSANNSVHVRASYQPNGRLPYD
jgi:hypothetical protein